MIESTTYMQSVENGELVPQITLSKLAVPEEEWTLLDMEKILEKNMNQWFGDMTNNAVSNLLVAMSLCISFNKLFHPR